MKKLFALIVVIAILAIGWYVGAPLFIDDVVDEEFPTEEISDESGMSEDEKAMMKKMENMTADEVQSMPPEQQKEMQKEMEEIAKKMPDEVIDDTMPEETMDEEEVAAEEVEETEEETGPMLVAQGQFVDADSFHKGSGTATLYKLQDESHLLRFTDFSVTNGPALSVFLTKVDGTKTNVGKLKGNMGNQNYPIPDEIDVTDYDGVLIYCVPFKVLFASAVLQ